MCTLCNFCIYGCIDDLSLFSVCDVRWCEMIGLGCIGDGWNTACRIHMFYFGAGQHGHRSWKKGKDVRSWDMLRYDDLTSCPYNYFHVYNILDYMTSYYIMWYVALWYDMKIYDVFWLLYYVILLYHITQYYVIW